MIITKTCVKCGRKFQCEPAENCGSRYTETCECGICLGHKGSCEYLLKKKLVELNPRKKGEIIGERVVQL